jgi:hypothetical protein
MKLPFMKSVWEELQEAFEDEQVVKELRRAVALKKLADKTGLPVYIEVKSLKFSYMYDPLERDKKKIMVKLLEKALKNSKSKEYNRLEQKLYQLLQ